MTASTMDGAAFALPDLSSLDLSRPYSILDRLHDTQAAKATHHDSAGTFHVLDRFAEDYAGAGRIGKGSSPHALITNRHITHHGEPSSVTIEALDALDDSEDETGSRLRAQRRPLTWDTWSSKTEYSRERSVVRISDLNLRERAQGSDIAEALLSSVQHGDDRDSIVPTYETEEALASLLQTASGFASALFAWQPSERRYVWARALTERPRLPRKKSEARKEDFDFQDERHSLAKLLSETVEDRIYSRTSFRISALSEDATTSQCARFMETGSLLRRIEEELNARRNRPTLSGEASAFCSAIGTVIDWLSEQLGVWRSDHRTSTILQAHETLSTIYCIVDDLASLLACNFHEPTAEGIAAVDSAKIPLEPISLVYKHLEAAMERSDASILVGIHLYLLDAVSRQWRESVAAWVGWPCRPAAASKVHDMLDNFINASKEATATATSKGKGTYDHRYSPLSGLEIEWAWDQREELDVGYVIRPRLLSTFVPLQVARDILEGGRAIQLLSQIVDSTHPILSAWRDTVQSLPHPCWTPSEYTMCEELETKLDNKVKRMRDECQRWLDGSRLARPTGRLIHHEIAPEKGPHIATAQTHACEDALDNAFKKYGELPSITDKDHESSSRPKMRLLHTIDMALEQQEMSTSHRTLAETTHMRILNPLVRWAKTVSASLLRVYGLELLFMRYIDMCKDFFLLGSETFGERVDRALFIDEGNTTKHKHNIISAIHGEGLSNLLKSSSQWPPTDSLVAPALNRALQESIAEWTDRLPISSMRASSTADRASPETEIADRLTFLLLPDRAESRKSVPRGIDAMSWLTLAFHPPSIIAPLMTPDAMHGYAKLFPFLLRLRRVDHVRKEVFRQLLPRRINATEGCLYEGDPDHTLLLRLRHELDHFTTTFARYAYTDIIEGIWTELNLRLAASLEHSETDGPYRDVFSLASLHEAAVAAMREGFFLKSHQMDTAAVLDTVMNAMLALASLVRASRSDDDFNTEDRVEIGRVFASFRRARQNFLRALASHQGRRDLRGSSGTKAVEDPTAAPSPLGFEEGTEGAKEDSDLGEGLYDALLRQAKTDLAQALKPPTF